MPKSNGRKGASGYYQRAEAAITREHHYSWSKDFLNGTALQTRRVLLRTEARVVAEVVGQDRAEPVVVAVALLDRDNIW